MRFSKHVLLATTICGGATTMPAIAAPVATSAPTAMTFRIAPQSLRLALRDFSLQSGIAIFADEDKVAGKTSPGFTAIADPETAIRALLAGSGLVYQRRGSTIVVRTADTAAAVAPPQDAEAVPGDIVVTARKREESIQDVPVAITAVTQAELTTRQVTGGPDLITQVPNMSFTKTNFTGYSIQIRGIGTQAISATTDPAVSVAFNNTPFIRNRFFEQEFYDLERIEILRGPQGTLYGRNATAGVVNLISAKPGWEPAAKASVDVGSYKQIRLEGMVNVPLVEDKLALRIAGAYTKRDGYAYNSLTDKDIDGRDLWSTRVSLRFQPTDQFDANLVWEHFQEDDDRLRSGKQLCKTDNISEVAGIPIPGIGTTGNLQSRFSQGCKPASFYSDESFGTPNGASLPYYLPLGQVFLPIALADPYVSRTQSRDLRSIESSYEPKYRARANIYELQLGYELNDNLRLVSETGYNTDYTFSTQDFNRFNTAPGAFLYIEPGDSQRAYRPGLTTPSGEGADPVTGQKFRTATFCDHQIGCSDRLLGIDLATARSHQFSQEFRVTSSNDGPFNFNAGVNFLRYRTVDKYYVMFNSLSLIAAISPSGRSADPATGTLTTLSPYIPGQTTNQECLTDGLRPPDVNGFEFILGCTYLDPNPIDKLNDLGHQYFLSKNPYRLSSYSTFGEAYVDLADRLKLTVGGRLTLDRKVAPQTPSWVIADSSAGYPVKETIRQRWLKPTGKVSLDWKPELSFTDSTLLYGSVARGYKAGGANPPRSGAVLYAESGGLGDRYRENSAGKPKTFQAEYVNAFEIGAKNELFDRKVTVNLTAFYYDYKNYQVSQIVDRAAVNFNFDTRIWGAEAETSWQAADFLSLGVKLGYQRTRLGKGSRAIDTMDRTAGNPDWTLYRPFPTLTSNCIFPTALFDGQINGLRGITPLGQITGGNPGGCELAYLFGLDPVTELPYVPNPTVGTPGSAFSFGYLPGYAGYDPSTAPNNGEGFFKNLEGNELPNAPRFTGTANADLSLPLGGDWIGTLHGDYYYQAKQWARVFNTPGYDRIRGYANVNAALLLMNKPGGWNIMAYVKNVFDKTAITGAFLNSDDTGLTTNIFLTEPRRYGLRVIKDFDGLPFGLGQPGDPHRFGQPYALTVEGGVQIQRRSAAVEPYSASLADRFGALDTFSNVQRERDFNWQNGTDVGATLAFGGGWQASGRVRYGKIAGKIQKERQAVENEICAYADPARCIGPYAPVFPLTQRFSDTLYTPKESHTIVDFAVGRQLALGTRSIARVGIGARLARLKSSDTLTVDGIPDRVIPDGVVDVGYDTYHRYTANITSRYRFRGIGPVVQADGSYRLFGEDLTGQVGVDWNASSGVLFGKRRASFAGTEQTREYIDDGTTSQRFFTAAQSLLSPLPPDTDITVPVTAYRSDTTAVPTLGGSLGLSYTLGRVALKGGYAYDRYFNAIRGTRGGTFDREIHGPYLKLAFGFGR